jgi:hypothetical protein
MIFPSLKLMKHPLTNFNDKDKPSKNSNITGNRKEPNFSNNHYKNFRFPSIHDACQI